MKIFLFLQGKTTSKSFLFLLACTYCMTSTGQVANGPLQLADQYFASGDYYTAANLYEQFLNPKKAQKPVSEFPLNVKKRRGATKNRFSSRTDILFRQAECYRLANYWVNAAALYKQCEEKNGSRYIDAAYWDAVCQRSLGNYATAEESLNRYLSADHANKEYKEEAAKEMQTLRYIRQQLARSDSGLYHTQKLNMPNSTERGAYAFAHISGNQFLVSSTQTDSVQINGVNPHHSRLFYASLSNDSLFEVTPVSLTSAGPLDNQGASSMSADGKFLYFSQWKNENGQTISSIYYAVKQNDGWSTPILIPRVNRKGHNSKQPFCSSDGKYLFFASDRPGGSGKFDIWVAPLNSDGTTGEPVNAGSSINTPGDEQSPFYHTTSSTLVFSSNGLPGMGGYDLFSAKGNESTWSSAENMGHPFNSSRDDIYFFSKEKTGLLTNAVVGSDRGTGCCLESYLISKNPKTRRLSGIVIDCKNNNPVSNAKLMLKSASGKTTEATTDSAGKYLFDLLEDSSTNMTLSISSEAYKNKVSPVQIRVIDESDLLTDVIINTDVCIEMKLVIKAEDVVTIYFDFDKSNLKPAAIEKLNTIAALLKESPNASFQISGYTDGLGSNEYNKILSHKRAVACANYLAKKGVNTKRISYESFGKCCPVEMEKINGRDNPYGRSRNRRALIHVQKD
ncbi:MAG TPA: OmpA family protein [Flavitalea sp.]|nr:OmpA family protein [Flavitalea sp.]